MLHLIIFQRVDKVLEWVSLPVEERPHIITLYFHEPDHTGHFVGPDAPQIGEAISYIDRMIGRLLDGLESRCDFPPDVFRAIFVTLTAYCALMAGHC